MRKALPSSPREKPSSKILPAPPARQLTYAQAQLAGRLLQFQRGELAEYMERRREPRIKTTLAVRVSGVDANGKAFTKLAGVGDVSKTGARLHGLREQLLVGAVITLHYQGMKADFRVMWVKTEQSSKRAEIGLRIFQSQPNIWRSLLGENPVPAKKDSSRVPAR